MAMDITEETGNRGDYVSYLLRMWRDSADDGSPRSEGTLWRASLQSPRTRDLVGFASLEDLFEFLRGQAGLEPSAKTMRNDE